MTRFKFREPGRTERFIFPFVFFSFCLFPNYQRKLLIRLSTKAREPSWVFLGAWVAIPLGRKHQELKQIAENGPDG